MNKIFSTTLALISTLATLPAAAADDFYLGAALGTRGNMDFVTSAGRLEAQNTPRPFALYGGYKFTDNLGIEAGYTSFGKYRYAGKREIDLSAMYLAAKGTVALNESWSAFGKVGAVRHAIDVTDRTLPVRDQNKVTPMFGIGVGYKVTERLNLDVQVVNYGRVKSDTGRLAFRQLHAGLNYSF